MTARALALGACLLFAGCPEPLSDGDATAERTGLLRLFLDGVPVAVIEERRSDGGAGRVIERTSRLLTSAASDVARVRATLDEDGFVREARYRRDGPYGQREVTLTTRNEATTLVTAHGSFEIAPGDPVILLELLHHARPERKTSVTFVDLASGEARPGSVLLEGPATLALDPHGALLARAEHEPPARLGPGRFLETSLAPRPGAPATLHPPLERPPGSYASVALHGLDEVPRAQLALDATGQRALLDELAVAFDPAHKDTTRPSPEHTRAAPFLEVDHPAVSSFPQRHATLGVASADALAIAVAIHELVDTTDAGGPPSALGTLTRKAGDCDDATALLVAALRARGHPARPVVGYRHHQGRLVPHAWAEVYDGSAWLPVDALVPGLGPFPTHLKLFDGLGSPLTMGRVLGALRVEGRRKDPAQTQPAR